MPFSEIKFLNRILSISIIGMACLCTPIKKGVTSEAFSSKTPHSYLPSTTLTGITGLNVIPTSRMDKKGTIRLGISTTDPYLHTFLGFQIFEPLYINFRQTGEVSSLNDSVAKLYPGIDFKLRLMNETARKPELSFGANSSFGHKKTASEYLSFSKRKDNFDYTAGIAWGRLAGKGHIKNPLGAISSHFDNNRNFNSDHSQNVNDWFTGEDISFFGGLEYFTPLKGLSLKAEYGAYDYTPERQTINGFNETPPWSLGLNYKPWNFVDISAGIIGGEKAMARLSLQEKIFNWPGKTSPYQEPLALMYPRVNGKGETKTALNLSAHQSTAQQIGRTARLHANQSSIDNQTIEIALKHKGLKGPTLRLIRRDLETAISNNHGSPEEIWRDITFLPNNVNTFSLRNYDFKNLDYRLLLDNKISLTERDTGFLYRSSAIAEIEKRLPFGLRLGTSPKVNIADNISNIRGFYLPSNKPIKSDENKFAANRFSLDRLYASWLYSLSQSTHISVSVGHLEEMFAGFGGEILYRPFGKTFSFGAEGWQVKKRVPNTTLAFETTEDSSFTGHLNFFYELPNKDITFYAKTGQYLGKDFGGTLGVQNEFENGAKLEGFLTATNQEDIDIFGNTSQLYGGIKVTLPFGNVPFVPQGSEIRLSTTPLSRDAGQTLDAPNKLYEVTEPISYQKISQNWSDLLH